MAVKKTKKKEQGEMRWLVPVLAVIFLAVLGVMARAVLKSGGSQKKEVQVITLIKPPPPPDVKEKPPEPEVPKEAPKQAIPTPTEAPTPQQNQPDQAQDDSPPAGSDLGVDAEGGAGSDGFGLVGKKGGRALTLGGPGGHGGGGGLNRLSLLSKYGSYAQQMQDDIKKRVKDALEQSGGRPKGKQQTVVRLTLSPQGKVLDFAIVTGSGIDRLDQAFRTALTGLKMSEAPPDGMPSTMTLRINTHG